MSRRDITSLRSTLEFLKERGELLTVKKEVDPCYEVVGIQKGLEAGPTLLFEKIKGYPHARHVASLFGNDTRVAAMFGVDKPQNLKFRYLEAFKNQIPPRVVEGGPCQEVVISKNINAWEVLPTVIHCEGDPGHLFGGGITLAYGLPGLKGSDVGFKRMSFRGKDWAALTYIPTSQLGILHTVDYKGQEIPITVNISTPPAVTFVAAGKTLHIVEPYGTDKLGVAGALQGSPIEVCKAKTVDAYAIANSEWVIEGYLTPEVVWETDEVEKIGQKGMAPFFPDFAGYLSFAHLSKKFRITAITHRKDKPIFFNPISGGVGVGNLVHHGLEAYYYELAERIAPGLVVDVNVPSYFSRGGVIFQVRKTQQWHETMIKNLLLVALGAGVATIAVAVDEDVDIYSADDLWWAVWTRANHEDGIFRGGGRVHRQAGAGQAFWGGSRALYPAVGLAQDIGMGIDATVRLDTQKLYPRAHYPVDKVDLSQWFTEEELAIARRLQSREIPWARLLAEKGW
ncbi:MAG: UbiD family decarboxylase [Chloroflexota bacterium]